eukprot:CAMPEP_0168373760 /NCGR_PEP_ID=MMETSP0228-20121227/8953_1 /TAXON_ID=133427 /ORGANISM="Protoceratium reticulatum, Strain CCCM 535 (=CCMP 1889)" /LENGTH=227 /DNA_ID=CAMNT_0008386689 /DNA_START=87 /DNA_END=770 /DNA_ORIENTATION=-
MAAAAVHEPAAQRGLYGRMLQKVAMAASVAGLLTACMLVFSSAMPSSAASPGAAPLMRREPRQVPAAPAPAAPRQDQVGGRPAEWGRLMRREGPVVAAATVPAADVAASLNTSKSAPERPALMRREARPLKGHVQARPKEWGTLMRREAQPLKPAAIVATEQGTQETPLEASEGRGPSTGGSRTLGLRGLLFAAVALVGFALQAKSTAAVLLQAPALEQYLAKGKAK